MERVLKAEEALEQLVLAIQEIVFLDELDRFTEKAKHILDIESTEQRRRIKNV